jgi:hypothetical protein
MRTPCCENVWVDHIARDSAIENIADAKVHDYLGRSARIDTAKREGPAAFNYSEIIGLPAVLNGFGFCIPSLDNS